MKKLIAISLSALLLFGSMGFSYITHFCMGHAMKSKMVMGHEDLACGMELIETDCDKEDDIPSFENIGCCENESLNLGSDDEFHQLENPSVPHLTFLIAYSTHFVQIEFDETIEKPLFEYPPPPTLDRNRQALLQTFVI